MLSVLQRYTSALMKIAYPQVCLCCRKDLEPNREYICAVCTISLPRTEYWKTRENPLLKQLWGRLTLEQAVALFFYEHNKDVTYLIREVKYHGNRELGVHLGKMLAGRLQEEGSVFQLPDVIVPMPLHPKRIKQRGFNQSELLAMGMSEVWGIPYTVKAVERAVYNVSQTSKGRFNRWENVNEIFALKQPKEIEGKHVLLLDDVVTTGSTLESCGRQLLKANIKLSVATVCTASKPI